MTAGVCGGGGGGGGGGDVETSVVLRRRGGVGKMMVLSMVLRVCVCVCLVQYVSLSDLLSKYVMMFATVVGDTKRTATQ